MGVRRDSHCERRESGGIRAERWESGEIRTVRAGRSVSEELIGLHGRLSVEQPIILLSDRTVLVSSDKNSNDGERFNC